MNSSYHRTLRTGTTQIARAMDTVAKRRPLAEQLVALRDQVHRCDKQLVTLHKAGRLERTKRVETIRKDAITKARLVAQALASGKVY